MSHAELLRAYRAHAQDLFKFLVTTRRAHRRPLTSCKSFISSCTVSTRRRRCEIPVPTSSEWPPI
jgi:hypothetical protein